jgi:hypothetical protein
MTMWFRLRSSKLEALGSAWPYFLLWAVVISIVLFAFAATAREGSIPLKIPGLDSDYVSPNIIEIRMYVAIFGIFGTITSILVGFFINRLFARLDKIEQKLDDDRSKQAANEERFLHVPTRDQTMDMIRNMIHENR